MMDTSISMVAEIELQATPSEFALLKETVISLNAICQYITRVSFEQNIRARKVRFDVRRFGFGAGFPTGMENALYVKADHTLRYATRYRMGKKPSVRRTSAVSYPKQGVVIRVDGELHNQSGRNSVECEVRIFTKRGFITTRGRAGTHHIELLRQFGTAGGKIVIRGSSIYVYANCKVDTQSIYKPDGWLGVDLGKTKIASDSRREHYTTPQMQSVRNRRIRLIRQLSDKRTPSARRKLKKTIEKMNRFAQDVNHSISRKIVDKAHQLHYGIALEDLTGVNERSNSGAGWSYKDLRDKIVYKAKLLGVPVEIVNPAYTSQTCSRCESLNTDRRDQHRFECLDCGHLDNADFNASINIAKRASANRLMREKSQVSDIRQAGNF